MESSSVRVNVSAPGKVILHGEHSVVYGKLAVAASIGLRTNVILEENCENDGFLVTFDTESTRFDLDEVEIFLKKVRSLQYDALNPESLSHNNLLGLVEAFLEGKDVNGSKLTSLKTVFYLFGAIASNVINELKSIHIRVSTELNIGAGTGSSASFSVCLAAAFFQYVKIKQELPLTEQFSEKELGVISNWAFCAEKIIHGLPSGVDNTICTYGTMVEFRKGQTPTLIKLKNPLKVLLINTKVPRETKKMVEIARKVLESRPDYFNTTLERMESIAQDAITNITNLNNDSVDIVGCYGNLHKLAKENHELLKNLGVSHSKLEEIVGILKEFQLGGKLTGAGGGGYALTLLPPSFPDVQIQKVVDRLNGSGFHAVLTDLGGPGVTLS